MTKSNHKPDARHRALAVINVVESFDLDKILSVAQSIGPYVPIPYFSTIICLLRLLCKLLPSVKMVTPYLRKWLDSGEPADEMPEEDIDKAKFKELLALSCGDEGISEDERKFLLSRALKAGYTEVEFEELIISKA